MIAKCVAHKQFLLFNSAPSRHKQNVTQLQPCSKSCWYVNKQPSIMQQWSPTVRCTEDSGTATGREDNQRNSTIAQAPLWWRNGVNPWGEEGTDDQRSTRKGRERKRNNRRLQRRRAQSTRNRLLVAPSRKLHTHQKGLCPVCDGVYGEKGDDTTIWVECIGCDWEWFHLHCTSIPPRQHTRLHQVDCMPPLSLLKLCCTTANTHTHFICMIFPLFHFILHSQPPFSVHVRKLLLATDPKR